METITDTTVTTRSGALRGFIADGARTFLGVPFAAPPFGPNRFLPPQPAAPWDGMRDALAFGPKCPQVPFPPPWDVIIGDHPDMGEDCLNLNVWAPDPPVTGCPVMVWIPGGMFESGTGSGAYPLQRFARDGVVAVAINYRVGAEGFLYFGEGVANLGLLDQIAALEWVRDNIAAFGGDPGNVTVVGESAGALSIGALLTMPRAAGLFRRAILESGGAYQAIPVEQAPRVGRALAERLGVAPTRDAIAAVPIEQLLRAQRAMKAEMFTHPDPARWGFEVVASGLPWQPVIDGETLPGLPIERLQAGESGDIDVIAGSNADEWNFFLIPTGVGDQITEEMLIGTIMLNGLPVEETLRVYRAEYPGAGPGELFGKLQGDRLFRIPALRLAEAHAGRAYLYEFAWHSPLYGGRFGAVHGSEIPFAFDTLDIDSEPMLGPDPPQSLADTMHAAWVRFITTGDAGWPAYDRDRRPTMRFDTASAVVEDPRSAVRKIWEGVR